MNNKLVVCVVADFKYLFKYFNDFKSDLTLKGKYEGDILIITNILCPTFLIRSTYGKNIKILRFKKIKFSKNTIYELNNNDTQGQPNRNKFKRFQWHKFHLFDKKLKKWDYIFYLDINMKIHDDINGLLESLPINKLYARSDSYPDYKNNLSSQFDRKNKTFEKLNNNYNLDIKNYFQTGLLFYDTNIIHNETKTELINLTENYHCTITNEQAICNLYFIFENDYYEELVEKVDNNISYFYWLLPNTKVLITKQNRLQYK